MTDKEIFFRNLGLPSLKPLGLEIAKAEGIYIYDTSGRKYIDLVSGICVSNLGHGNPQIIDAIMKQLENYHYVYVYGEFILSPQVKLVEKLSSVLPESLSCTY